MRTRIKALLAFVALFAAAFAYACTLTDITGVEVGQLTIQPPSATILEGATVQLSVQAQDQLGGPLPVGAVVWSIGDPSIISISDTGLVRALKVGETTVQATLEGVSKTASVTVLPRPTIAVNATAISFLGAVGGSQPIPVVLQISNVGGGDLGGLSAAVAYQQGQPTDWLNVSLASTTAPTTLTVSVITAGLQEGTYEANVVLSAPAAGNSPVTLPVELRLTLTEPVIAVNPESVEFQVEQGAEAPDPKAVAITNAGGGTLTGLTTFVDGGTWLTVGLSSTTAPATLTIQASPAGLGVGTYRGTVLVKSGVALNEKEVDVTLSVSQQPIADLGVTKSGPAGASVGDTVVFVLTVTNAGPDQANSATLIDSLPSGLSFLQASPNGSGVGRIVTWSLGSLASGATSVDSVWAVATTQGSFSNIARAASTALDPQPANNRATHLLQVVPIAANLVVEKTGPATAAINETIQYTIGVINGGPNAAENVVLIDSLPAGVTFVEATPPVAQNGSALTWDLGTLNPGGDFSATVTVMVNTSGVQTNVARVASSTFDPAPSNNRATLSTAVDVQADLSLSKTGPATAEAGDTITYEITVSNSGPDGVANATVVDSLPVGVTFLYATGNGIQAAGSVVSWSLQAIGAGASEMVTVTVKVDSTGTLTNIAKVFSSSPDPDTDDLRDIHSTVVTGADLSVTKTATDDGSPAIGEFITYTILVSNNGPDNATNVAVSDTLPPGVTFSTASGGGTEAGGVVTWAAIPALAVGADTTLTVEVTIDQSVDLTNWAVAASATGDPNPANNAAFAFTPAPGASADLSMQKTATDDGSPVVGEQVTYELTVSNAGPSTASIVVVTDTLPSGVTFVAASGSGTEAGGVVTWSAIPTLAVGADTTLTVTVTMDQPTTLTNTGAVTAATNDPSTANNVDTAATTPDPSADLSILKTAADDGSPVVGEQITYTLTVTNNGPNTAAGIVVTDTLPGGVSYVSSSVGGSHSGGVVTWGPIASLASGSNRVFTATVTITATGTLTNTGAVTSTTFDPSLANNKATAVTAPGASADLEVEKTGPATVTAGTQAVYTITVTNNGPTTATNVVVTDTLPTGMTFASSVPAPASQVGRAVTWSPIASLANGASQVFTLTANVSPSASGSLENVARASSTTSDPNTGNNRGTRSSTVSTSADISVTKTVGGTVTAGNPATYTITVTNNGPSDASNVVVTDTLPAGMSFSSATPNPVSQNGQGMTWAPIATLAAGANQVYSLTADVAPDASGSLTNMAKASAATTDPTPLNNRATRESTVDVSADVAISKDGPGSAVPGTQITYNFTVDNLGPSDATGLVVTDPIPGGVSWVSATGGGTYDGGSNTVTWNLGDLTASGAPITFNLTVLIAPTTGGAVTNTASLTSTTNDPNTPNQAIKTTSVTGANVFVTKTAPATASQGDPVAYTVTVENSGPSTATGVVVTDTLPAGVTYVSSPGGAHNGGAGTNGVVTWTVGTMAKTPPRSSRST